MYPCNSCRQLGVVCTCPTPVKPFEKLQDKYTSLDLIVLGCLCFILSADKWVVFAKHCDDDLSELLQARSTRLLLIVNNCTRM